MTADTYFSESNHVASRIWRAFDPGLRVAALAQATRQIDALLGDAEVEDSAYDYACFEQALHILKASGVAMDHDNNRPDFIPPDGDAKDAAPAGSPYEVCAAALTWIHGLGANGQRVRPVVTLVRG